MLSSNVNLIIPQNRFPLKGGFADGDAKLLV